MRFSYVLQHEEPTVDCPLTQVALYNGLSDSVVTEYSIISE